MPAYRAPAFSSATRALAGTAPGGALAVPPAYLPPQITCSSCSMPLPAGGGRCLHCGTMRALATVGTCVDCGASNPPTNLYCGRCGRMLVRNALATRTGGSSSLPVLGSLILPGLGQMMNGEAMKGFVLLGVALLLISQGQALLSPLYLLITAIATVDAAVSRSRREARTMRQRDWAQ